MLTLYCYAFVGGEWICCVIGPISILSSSPINWSKPLIIKGQVYFTAMAEPELITAALNYAFDNYHKGK